MNKTWLLVGALALTLAPVFAGGEECKKECGDKEECAECSECEEGGECCSVEKMVAMANEALDGAAKARAESAAAVAAMPEAKRQQIQAAQKFLMETCPGAKAMVASLTATSKLLALASAADKTAGVADHPRAKLTARVGGTYAELCRSMGCAKGACDMAAPDAAAFAAATKASIEEAKKASEAWATLPDAMKAMKPEDAAKLGESMEFLQAECPCFNSMGATMTALSLGLGAIARLEGPEFGEKFAELGTLRGQLLDSALALAKASSCGSCGEECDEDSECDDEKSECEGKSECQSKKEEAPAAKP